MIATRKTHAPCNVFDANGLQWKRLRWLNTDTGEAEQIVLDAEGNFQLNEMRTDAVTQIVKLPTPVLLVPIDPKYKTREEWDAAIEAEERAITASDLRRMDPNA